MSQSIKPQDIKVGDRIRVTSTDELGGIATYEDEVTHATRTNILTKSFSFLPNYDAVTNRTYELIERPEPVEPTKTGTIVKTEDGQTYIRVPREIREGVTLPDYNWVGFREFYNYVANEWQDLIYKGIKEVIEP